MDANISASKSLSMYPHTIEARLFSGIVESSAPWLAPDDAAETVVKHEADEYLLLREMHHRMANTLTMLTAQLRREFRPLATAEFRDRLARYEARTVAFGELNRLLTVGTRRGLVDIREYVERLRRALSESVLCHLNVRCEATVEAAALPAELCERLGLVIAELVTNAAKHAFDDCADGLIRVDLVSRFGSWRCTVSDNGSGLAGAAPGAGSKILDGIVRAMGGRLVARSGRDGFSVTVAFSADDFATPEARRRAL